MSRPRVVLWGGRASDIQFGSTEDKLRQVCLKLDVGLYLWQRKLLKVAATGERLVLTMRRHTW